MFLRCRRFEGRAQARSRAQQAQSGPQLVLSETSVGIRPSHLATPILDGFLPTHPARRTRGYQKRPGRSIEAFIAGGRTPGIAGLDTVEIARPLAQITSLEPPVSSRGQLAFFPLPKEQTPDLTLACQLPSTLIRPSGADRPAGLHICADR